MQSVPGRILFLWTMGNGAMVSELKNPARFYFIGEPITYDPVHREQADLITFSGSCPRPFREPLFPPRCLSHRGGKRGERLQGTTMVSVTTGHFDLSLIPFKSSTWSAGHRYRSKSSYPPPGHKSEWLRFCGVPVALILFRWGPRWQG
mgnify:CR=1 FL=1